MIGIKIININTIQTNNNNFNIYYQSQIHGKMELQSNQIKKNCLLEPVFYFQNN